MFSRTLMPVATLGNSLPDQDLLAPPPQLLSVGARDCRGATMTWALLRHPLRRAPRLPGPPGLTDTVHTRARVHYFTDRRDDIVPSPRQGSAVCSEVLTRALESLGGTPREAGLPGTRSDELNASPQVLFPQEDFKPVGACPAYSVARLGFTRHSVPAAFFDEGRSLPGTCVR